MRQKLSELTEQAIAVVAGASFDHDRASHIGTALAEPGYLQPEAPAGTQEALTREFFQDLLADLAAAIQPRFAILLGRMSSSFFQAALAGGGSRCGSERSPHTHHGGNSRPGRASRRRVDLHGSDHFGGY